VLKKTRRPRRGSNHDPNVVRSRTSIGWEYDISGGGEKADIPPAAGDDKREKTPEETENDTKSPALRRGAP